MHTDTFHLTHMKARQHTHGVYANREKREGDISEGIDSREVRATEMSEVKFV